VRLVRDVSNGIGCALIPSGPKLVHYSEEPLRVFKAQNVRRTNNLMVNDLYSFIDKGTPSNEKAMDCDSF
jgi:hypothetical protein